MTEPFSSKHDIFINKFKQTENSTILGRGRELLAQKKDMTVFPVDIALDEMIIDNKRMFTGIIRDVSERKEDEQNLIKAKEEAERANNAKSDFLSSMSHELRTPLNAILGFSQILEMDATDEKTRSNTQEIIDAGNHLLTLIEEILDLSKVETGNVELSIEKIGLNEILNNALYLINPIAEKHSIQIENKVSTSFNINANEMRFKQVLLNILSNAIKYNSKQGKVTVKCDFINTQFIKISILTRFDRLFFYTVVRGAKREFHTPI